MSRMTTLWRIGVFIVAAHLLLAPAGAAQSLGTGGIAGVVKDTSGAILPGVTVEAASPALIEKVRTAITDGQGLYRFVDLRLGVYTVTFTLPGFATVKREGVEVTTGFTASANVDMRVGALEETITVTGETPLVDIQNSREQKVFSRDVLDAVPVGKSLQSYAALIPGATIGASSQDVGGVTQGSTEFTIHGGTNDARNMVAGISFDSPQRPGGNLSATTNRSAVQEVSVETGGIGAESQTGGVQTNFVPKDGGNTFSGNVAIDGSSGKLQQKNLTQALRDRGLPAPNALKKLYDYSFGVGGPIKKDSLWFFTAHRWQGSEVWQPAYWNKLPKNSWFYEPDLSRQAFSRQPYQISNARVTWQATSKNKVTFNFDNQANNCQCSNSVSASVAPEAAADHKYSPQYLGYTSWTFPATNRLLFEGTAAIYHVVQNAVRVEGTTPDLIPVIELSKNFTYRARANMTEGSSYYHKDLTNYTQRLVMSYVTGSHAFKTGFTLQQNLSDHTHTPNGDSLYRFQGGVPVELQLWATPWYHKETMTPILGIFAQDQWTVRRLTLNLGVRYDSMSGYIPEQTAPAGRWIPERHFDRIDNVLNWKDVNPRLGVAYNLFGNGRTAVKATIGRYTLFQGTGDLISAFNPMNQIVLGATRAWTDANGDFIPQESELQPISNNAFGQVVSITKYSDDIVRGFNAREYNWQGSVSLQHELWQGTAVNVGYFRTWYGNPLAYNNVDIKKSDYDEYCITVPVDSRLPGGGGNRLCGLWDLNPTMFGKVHELISPASDYGKASKVFNGVDMTLSSRFRKGALIAGGMSTGATVTDTCALSTESVTVARTQTAIVVSSPNTRFCRNAPPWSAGTQLKFYGVYPLPADIQVSAIFQNLPGPQILANYNVTNAIARPSLNRNLSAGRATIPLIEPGTQFESRFSQLDFRVAKVFKVRKMRITATVDADNALNASPILSENATYGTSWKNVQSILAGRLFRFGTQFEF